MKQAGVTTGAFYRYYDSKESLFAALVDEHANYVLNLFNHTVDDFERLPGEEQTEQMYSTSSFYLDKLLDYVYAHSDAFKLLIGCAEGTAYADFIHQLVVREVESTYAYMQTLTKMGYSVEKLNKKLIHIIASGLFSGIFEVIIHDMSKEEAREYLLQFHRFYTAGWSELLHVKFLKE